MQVDVVGRVFDVAERARRKVSLWFGISSTDAGRRRIPWQRQPQDEDEDESEEEEKVTLRRFHRGASSPFGRTTRGKREKRRKEGEEEERGRKEGKRKVR